MDHCYAHVMGVKQGRRPCHDHCWPKEKEKHTIERVHLSPSYPPPRIYLQWKTLYRGFNPYMCHNTTKVGIQPIRHVEPEHGRKQRAWHLWLLSPITIAKGGWQRPNEP